MWKTCSKFRPKPCMLPENHRCNPKVRAWTTISNAVWCLMNTGFCLCYTTLGCQCQVCRCKMKKEKLPRRKSKKSALANDFRCEDKINKLHAGTNVKSQCGHSLIIFTQYGKGQVSVASIQCWQALFRINKQSSIRRRNSRFLCLIYTCVNNNMIALTDSHNDSKKKGTNIKWENKHENKGCFLFLFFFIFT